MVNPKIFIMDCTYKSNKYGLLLLNIVKSIYLNISFYIAFIFFFKKQKDDFIYFLPFLIVYINN